MYGLALVAAMAVLVSVGVLVGYRFAQGREGPESPVRKWGRAFVFYVAMPAGVGIGAWYVLQSSVADVSALLTNKSLSGEFRSTSEEFGSWSLSPVSCEVGRNADFMGMVFRFPVDAPVEEIRIDGRVQGDNVVEIRYPDADATVRRVREADCREISGDTELQNITYNGRPVIRAKGVLVYDCLGGALRGRAEYDGCLPNLN